MSKGAFLECLKREIDSAWRSMAIADLRRDRGLWGAGSDYMPTEQEIADREKQLEAESNLPETVEPAR